jgi:hypothetical protein
VSECRACGDHLVWREEGGKFVPYSLQVHYKAPAHIEAVRGRPRKRVSRAESANGALYINGRAVVASSKDGGVSEAEAKNLARLLEEAK